MANVPSLRFRYFRTYYVDPGKTKTGMEQNCKPEVATHIVLPIEEYNELVEASKKPLEVTQDDGYVLVEPGHLKGLQNCLRIVRDRAKQQVDKGKADKHGYTLISADKRAYGGRGDDLIRIVRRTPHSIKIPLEDVKDIILLDLIEYYHYVDPDLLSVTYTRDRSTYTHDIRVTELLKGAEQRANGTYADHDFYVENDEIGRAIRRIVDDAEGKLAFDMDSLTPDYGQGVYKVGYWANDYM